MNDFFIHSKDFSVGVKTTSDSLSNFFYNSLFPRGVIPAYKISDNSKNCDFNVELMQDNIKSLKLDFDNKIFSYKGDVNSISEAQATYLVMLMLQRVYQEKGYYYLHSSSVSKNNKGILLVGPYYSGKSLSSLELCLNHKYNMIGDDAILLDNNGTIIDGNTHLSLNKDLIMKKFPQLLNEKYEYDSVKPNKIYFDRSIFNYQKKPVVIDKIYYVTINNFDLQNYIFSSSDAALKVFLDLSEDIRGVGYTLINDNYTFSSVDTQFLSEQRLLFSKKLSKDCSVQVLRGRLEDVCNFIDENL